MIQLPEQDAAFVFLSAECHIPLQAGLNLDTDTPPPVHLPSTTTWTPSGFFNMEADPPPREPRVSEEKLESKGVDPTGASSSSSDAVQEKKEETLPPGRKFTVPSSLAWIPANCTWSHLKPVIRCSLMAWVSILLSILGAVARPLGQVSTTFSWRWKRLTDVGIRLISCS